MKQLSKAFLLLAMRMYLLFENFISSVSVYSTELFIILMNSFMISSKGNLRISLFVFVHFNHIKISFVVRFIVKIVTVENF